MVCKFEGEQEFAVDVGEQGKADHGKCFNWVDENGNTERLRIII